MEKYNRPEWDEYFLSIAQEVGKRSTCLRRRYGAIIVKDNIIARSSEHNRVNIYAEIHDESNEVEKHVDICIDQLDSFSDKNIHDDKLMLKGNIGQIGDIKRKLVSLCDFFIESRFKIKGKKSFARVEYLKDSDISREPEVTRIGDCDGFKYCFRFYL